MNRNAFIAVETLIWLVIAFLITVLIISIMVRLIPKSEVNFPAQQNLNLLTRRIATAQANGETAFSLVMSLPDNTGIIGLDADQKDFTLQQTITYTEGVSSTKDPVQIMRSELSGCEDNKVCFCVIGLEDRKPIACASQSGLKGVSMSTDVSLTDTTSGGLSTVNSENQQKGSSYELLILSGGKNLQFKINGDALVLS